MKKYLTILALLVFAYSEGISCQECETPTKSRALGLEPTVSLYSMSLASAGSEAVALVASEDDEDITSLSTPSSLNLKESSGISRINKRNLYKKSVQGRTGFEVGDWIDLPARKVEVSALKSKTANARGYVLKVYTHLEQGKFENNHLSFEIEVIGGYKRNFTDANFISESDVKNGDIYIVEAKKVSTNGTIKSVNKVYRYFEEAAKPLDNWWYYEKNGVKTKAEKIIQKQSDDSFLITKRIHRKNAIDETSEMKIKEAVKESERVVKNGRIRRGENTPEVSATYTRKTASTSKITLDANGNVFRTKSEANSFYLNDSAEHQKGKVRTKTNKDGTITLFEYHPNLEGNFRTYTTQRGFELKDISGDGVIGIEDLQNTPVTIEDKESIDWQGSRHSKRLINKKAKASFSTTTNANGYNVVLSDEKVVSKKEYEHKRTENGGVIEEISTYKADSNGELQLANVSAFEFETLALGEPVTKYSLSNLSEESQVGKTIYVSDGGSIGFSASGFLSGTVPNYANAPRFDSTANTYYSNFRLTGIESETSSTISLPWGGTYTANGFALVSGKSTLEVELTLDYSGTTLYEATYVYIDGTFHLGEWTYYNRDMSEYDLRGTYKHNNTYSTQTALDSNNIRTFTDFNGSEYQIGYSDSTESVEIFRRDIGVASNEYGNQYDKITVYTKNLEDGSCASCGNAPEEYGQKAVSYFVSSQIGGSGGVNNADTLLYQTYEYSLASGIKTLEVDKYGIVIRREYTDNNDGTYTLKEIRPGFTSENPYSTLVADKETNETISLTGLGVVDEYHYLDGDKDSYAYEEITYGSGVDTRTVYKEYENGNLIYEYGLNKDVTNTYDSEGRIIETISDVDITYTYDAFGNQTETTTSYLNEDFTESAVSTSGITISYEYSNGALWKVITSNASGDILTQKERLSGFANLIYENNPITEEQITFNNGKKSVSRTTINRSAKLEENVSESYANETSTQALNQNRSKTFNGVLCVNESSEFSNTEVSSYQKITYAYNSDGTENNVKLYLQNNLLQLENKYFYEPSQTLSIENENGEIKTIKSLGFQCGSTILKGELKQGSKYIYIPRTEKNAGQVKEVIQGNVFNTDDSVSAGSSIRIAYDDMGLATHYWGNGATPAMYLYNEFGEITDMYLFKTAPTSASDFTADTWNSSYTTDHNDVEHTQWVYDDNGNVIEKIDALNKSYTASYDTYGRMDYYETPSGVETSYTYASGNIVTSKTIGTETISYTYDSKQRVTQASVSAGNYTYTYTGDITMPSAENLPDGFKIGRTFDSNKNITQVVLRDAQSNIVYETNYTYDASSKLQNLSAQNRTIAYSYNEFGNVSEINLNNTAKIVNTYDDLQRQISSAYKVGTAELRKNEYTLTPDNKISKILIGKNGTTIMNWQYEYFENMTGLKKARLNRENTNTLFDTYSQEEFEYDLAGNPYRYKKGTNNWNTVSSTKNNQTSQINYASDAVIPIRGKASSSATLNVSVDGEQQTYTRPNTDEFAYGLNAYSSVKKFQEIKVEAVDTDNTTTPPTTIKTMQRGKTYVEATPENFVYDNNGNLSSDGRWNYTWNAENRLIGIETTTAAVTAGTPKEKYVYSYDWTGRKVKSERYEYEYEDNAWVLVSTNKRYYDDYNLIYETTEYADGSPTEVRKYYYGTDLLGSVYGSAGTGGLRMIDINGELCYAFNNQVGSIEALYGADTDTASAVKAEYLYSAYGEIMMKSGDFAEKNNITYSTRYQEANTGLLSYTYRHYSPRLKKWINKDPIAEQGGINLYVFSNNMPNIYYDKLGNKPVSQDKHANLKKICKGYTVGSKSAKCCRKEKWVTDTYPGKAENICGWFIDTYNGSKKVACVAKCLVEFEQENQKQIINCSDRNSHRLGSHLYCYWKCDFYSDVFLSKNIFNMELLSVGIGDVLIGAFRDYMPW